MENRMKLTLGNIKWWRFKRILLLLGCMGSSIFIISVVKIEDLNIGFLVAGFILYAFISDSLWLKKFSYELYVEDKDTEIYIRKKKKEYVIRKSSIKDVLWKEIRYGGRWMEPIGYRLIVIADRKYVFDSVLLDKDAPFKDHSLEELFKLLKKSIL